MDAAGHQESKGSHAVGCHRSCKMRSRSTWRPPSTRVSTRGRAWAHWAIWLHMGQLPGDATRPFQHVRSSARYPSLSRTSIWKHAIFKRVTDFLKFVTWWYSIITNSFSLLNQHPMQEEYLKTLPKECHGLRRPVHTHPSMGLSAMARGSSRLSWISTFRMLPSKSASSIVFLPVSVQ